MKTLHWYLFGFISCLLQRKHKYIYIGRRYRGKNKANERIYTLRYGCLHCPWVKQEREIEP